MSDSGVIEIKGQVDVGVSYTLNNTQPVKCSYIGADPLFFMDDDILEDEDSLDLMMEMEDLDHNIERLNQKLQQYERFSEDQAATTEDRMSKFEEDLIDITQKPGQASYTPKIESVLNLMEQSRFAAALLESARENNVSVEYSDQVETANYDAEANDGAGIIQINPNMKLPDTVLVLARELRRHWQKQAGAGIHPLAFEPDQAILVNRMQKADLAVAMVRTAWEMYLADYKSPWTRIEYSSLGDVSRAFAREAFLDFRTLNNGEAASAAFETWFLSERCRVHDRDLIQTMLAEYYTVIYRIEGAAGQFAMTKLISRLGEMPFGKNYLAQYAGLITGDPVFTDVRDRSNANFLWFIKFEQSFLQTEQELQTFSPSKRGSSKEPLQPHSRNKDKMVSDQNENTKNPARGNPEETVIEFPQERWIKVDADRNKTQRLATTYSEETASVVLFPKLGQ